MSLRMAERALPIAKHFTRSIALSRDVTTLSTTKANDTLRTSIRRMLTNNTACVTLEERLTLYLCRERAALTTRPGQILEL